MTAAPSPALERPARTGGPVSLIARNLRVYRRSWRTFVTGLFEPLLWLLSIGVGVGSLIEGFDLHGVEVPYADYVAPAMMATAAMNGALMDATFGTFFKLKFEHVYDAVLATPMTTRHLAVGEVAWAVLRGGVYSAAFLVVMLVLGYVGSWWGVLALPAALLVGFAFAALGMALTTFMRTWQDLDLITLAMLPMFLFSATFFPIETYPVAVRWVVEVSPLYRGVVLLRELTTGLVGWGSVVSVAYLVALGLVSLKVADRRLGRLLLT